MRWEAEAESRIMTLDLIGLSKEVGGSDRAESRIMTLDLDLDLDLVKIVALQRSRHQAPTGGASLRLVCGGRRRQSQGS